MAFEPPVVVYDACVLYPFHTRNLLTQCAVDRLVEARWTDAIHAEWIRNLAASSRSLPIERLHKIRDLMNRALPGADVRGYERHIGGLELPDPDDRHVLAAAITAGASRIVTWNLRDFPDQLCPDMVFARRPPTICSCTFTTASLTPWWRQRPARAAT